MWTDARAGRGGYDDGSMDEEAREVRRGGAASETGARRALVIGVAGGIGSGKSTLSRAFAELGFLVVDADEEVREALNRPEVRQTLVSWWGDRVLGRDGRIDRAAVARIVFKEGGARKKLEGLLHPIVISRCERAVGEATRAGMVGVVIDAPLLHESSLDLACDAVVFVDASREVREARVARTRGWAPGELSRREAAQLPLEEKRKRSRFLVENNSGDLSVLEGEASRIYAILRSEAESRVN